MNHDPKKPVSLEDLLHLKRSERPPEQFWVQFESELRAKQLAAIVQHRPWWTSSERLFRLLARNSLPIGATAVLTLGLLSFHEYQAHSARSEVVVPSVPAVSTARPDAVPDEDSAINSPPAVAAVSADSNPASVPSVAIPSASVAAAAKPARAAAAAIAIAADYTADPFSALVGGPQKVAPRQSDAWSHFGDQQLATNSLAATVGFAPRAFNTAAAEPLSRMASPSDARRAMLLGGSLPRAESATVESVALSPDTRLASRLSDERLYESIHRYGLGGNQISVRF